MIDKLNKTSVSFSSTEGKAFLQNLATINLLVTHSCNLNCSYCFEKHYANKNVFDLESIYKVFDFIRNVNNGRQRTINFFGGEPLLEQKLILDFLRIYKDEIHQSKNVDISLITNGILLTQEFIDEFLGYPFTTLIISLDTNLENIDNRNLGKKTVDSILEKIKYVTERYGAERLFLATSISALQVEYLEEFTDMLIMKYGVRNFFITPVIPLEETWNIAKIDILRDVLFKMLSENIKIHFLESSGLRYISNCMLGYDSFSVDSTGDMGGCYFSVNRKNDFEQTLLGNIFKDEFYHENFKTLQNYLKDALDSESKCVNCKLKYCHQCFAGNYIKYGTFVKPEQMCQEFAALYEDLENKIQTNKIMKKFKIISDSLAQGNVEYQVNKMLSILFELDTKQKQDKEIDDSVIKDKSIIIDEWFKWLKLKYNLNNEVQVDSLEDLVILYAKLKYNEMLKVPYEKESLDRLSFLILYLHLIVLNKM